MGCASSKPSSSSKDKHKKNIKSKKSVENGSNGKLNDSTPKLNGFDSLSSKAKAVNLSPSLIEQIEQNSQQVIDHICGIVHRDLNAELISHSQSQKATQTSGSASMAAVVQAAAVAKDNDDLIRDVASKAVLLIANKNQNYRPNTYNDLNDSLKSTDFLFKNQTNKNRIIDLTVETIENSVDAINNEIEACGNQFSLVEFLKKNKFHNDSQMTPPQTPEIKNSKPIQSTPNIDWDNAQLLSRAQATEVARILFLSNKARPVVHASPKAKDAYIVNKQVDDTEIALSKDEIDQILNRYDEQPRYIELVENYQSISVSPITPQSNRSYLNETPHLSAYTNRAIMLDNCLNESVDENKNEELTNVTQDETIQFASDTQESIKTSEINAELLSDDVNKQQSDNTSNSDEKNASLFVKTTIITETCVITPPLDNDNLEKGQLDPTLKQSLLDDRFYNNDSFKTEPPVNGEEENQAAIVIQSAVRGHEARHGEVNQNETEIDDLGVNQAEFDSESEKAAVKIQATYRGFKTRKDLHHQKEVIRDKSKANSSEESTLASNAKASLDNKLEKSVDLKSTYSDNKNDLVADYLHNCSNNNSDIISNTFVCGMDSNKRDKEGEPKSLLDRAATKIQSTFRGYKTRKVIKTNTNKSESASNCGKNINNNPELAAIKIQSTFRGYKTRKQLKPKLVELRSTKN